MTPRLKLLVIPHHYADHQRSRAADLNPLLGIPARGLQRRGAALADEEFNHVLCLDVLEHIACPDLAVREVYRCLKLGGTALFHVPVSDVRLSFDWVFARLWPETWAGRMTAVGHDYARMLSGPELVAALSREGFRVRHAERFNVLLQNLFDYHLMTLRRILRLVFELGVRLGPRRYPLSFRGYHRVAAPVIDWLTFPDRLLARGGIGASMYCLVRKDNG